MTYVTASSVYIDAGRDDGLVVGDFIELVRGEQVVARFRVTDLSTRRAACAIETAPTPGPAVGEAVRFHPHPPPATPAGGAAQGSSPPSATGTAGGGEGTGGPATSSNQSPSAGGTGGGPAPQAAPSPGGAAAPAPGGPAWTPGTAVGGGEPPAGPQVPLSRQIHDLGLRGRIGASYIWMNDADTQLGYSRPGLDLRLDGNRIGGSAFGTSVDVRAYRTYRSMSDGTNTTEDLNRVYRLAVFFQPAGSGFRVTLGRQFSPSLASVSLFDGLLGEYQGRRWSGGVLAGTQPDLVSYAYSSQVREYAGYLEIHSTPTSNAIWALTTGLVGSYTQGDINREFFYLQGRFEFRRLYAWLSQEVDLNRGWKKQAEGSSVSPTSTFVSLRLRATDALSFNAGYDDRRQVRLFQDHVTPETEFDDRFREGAWVGTDLRLWRKFSMGLSARTTSGGSAGRADAYSLYAGVYNLTPLSLDIRGRGTRYTSDTAEGWLDSLSLGIGLGSRARFELSGGQRTETDPRVTLPSTKLTWGGASFDVSLGRSWYFLLSAERASGDNENTTQGFGSISFRF